MAGFVADAELGFASDHDQQLFVIGLAMPNLYARQGSRDEPGKTEASHTPARLWQWLEAAAAGINHKFICNFQPKSVGLNALQVAKFGENLYRIRSASALVFAEVCGVPAQVIRCAQGRNMLSDLDILRAAHLMMHEFGGDAELEAANYIDRMRGRGDWNALLTWARIQRTIAMLDLTTTPTGRPN